MEQQPCDFFFSPFHVFTAHIFSLYLSASNCNLTSSHQNKIKPIRPISILSVKCIIHIIPLLLPSNFLPTPSPRPGAFLTETLLFELALQETTNSAPLSRNICLKFVFGDFSLMAHHLARPRPLVPDRRGVFFNKPQIGCGLVPPLPQSPLVEC